MELNMKGFVPKYDKISTLGKETTLITLIQSLICQQLCPFHYWWEKPPIVTYDVCNNWITKVNE